MGLKERFDESRFQRFAELINNPWAGPQARNEGCAVGARLVQMRVIPDSVSADDAALSEPGVAPQELVIIGLTRNFARKEEPP